MSAEPKLPLRKGSGIGRRVAVAEGTPEAIQAVGRMLHDLVLLDCAAYDETRLSPITVTELTGDRAMSALDVIYGAVADGEISALPGAFPGASDVIVLTDDLRSELAAHPDAVLLVAEVALA